MAERRLGRGLDFLISRTSAASAGAAPAQETPVPAAPPPSAASAEAPATRQEPLSLPLEQIDPNPFQPRREFEPGALAELEESVRMHGVLQPVAVRRVGERFQLIAGERRFRASRAVGLASIPAVVKQVSDGQMRTLALVENLQRADLNAIDTAVAYREMMDEASLTQETVAELVGKSRVAVANTLRLLDLPADLQELVSRGTLSAGHARALLALDSPEAMRALAGRVSAEGLSVRETERATHADASAPPAPARPPRLRPVRSAHIEELESKLRTSLGTRVIVKPGRGKRGKIVLYYASLEDFDRLFEILVSPEESGGGRGESTSEPFPV